VGLSSAPDAGWPVLLLCAAFFGLSPTGQALIPLRWCVILCALLHMLLGGVHEHVCTPCSGRACVAQHAFEALFGVVARWQRVNAQVAPTSSIRTHAFRRNSRRRVVCYQASVGCSVVAAAAASAGMVQLLAVADIACWGSVLLYC
jgi:hypothetical protein